jgi:hypothetical protein
MSAPRNRTQRGATERKPPGRPTRVVRERALAMLAEGASPSAVALACRVDAATVWRWRDTPEAREIMAAAALERETARRADAVAQREAANKARAALVAGAERASTTVLNALAHHNAHVRLRAAREVLDRVGVVRTQRLELGGTPLDLTLLTDEEFATLEALVAKARPADTGKPGGA